MASISSFPFFPALPHSGFPGAPFPLTLSRFPPFFPAWFPMPLFPGFRTRLSVRFLSSYPASLPQLFHRCFPSFPLSLLFRAFPFPPLSFVRFGSVLTTQPSVSSFPLFPISPDGGSLGAHWFLASPLLSSSVQPVSMPSFRFWYSASCDFLSPLAVSCHRHYSAAGLLFPARPSPLLSL